MKRWWVSYLLLGVAGFLVHFHLARKGGSAPSSGFILAHVVVAFLLYLAALRAARRLGEAGRRAALLWTFTVALGVLGVHLSAPFLVSSEVHRYRWEGRVAEAGWNPYEVAPADPELADLRVQFRDPVPNPERRGLFPPLAELLFYGLARSGRDTVFHYRLLASVMTILAGLVFLPLCRTMSVPVTRATVLLWNPLLLIEAGVNGHIEPVGIFFLLASLALLTGGHQLTPSGLLALATLIRGFPIALFPLYFRRIPPYRIVLFFLVLLAGALPFIGAGRELLSGMREYLGHERMNAGLFLLIEGGARLLGNPEWARPFTAALGVAIAIALYLTDDGSGASIIRRGFYLALPPLLLGPVIQPWSMLWLLPFVALADRDHPLRLAGLVLTGTVTLAWAYPAGTEMPAFLPWVEFGPAFLLAAWGGWNHFRKPLARESTAAG